MRWVQLPYDSYLKFIKFFVIIIIENEKEVNKMDKFFRIFYNQDYVYECTAPNEDIALIMFEVSCPGATIDKVEWYDEA